MSSITSGLHLLLGSTLTLAIIVGYSALPLHAGELTVDKFHMLRQKAEAAKEPGQPYGVWVVNGGVSEFSCKFAETRPGEPAAIPPPHSHSGGLPTQFVLIVVPGGTLGYASESALSQRPHYQTGSFSGDGPTFVVNDVSSMKLMHDDRLDLEPGGRGMTFRRCIENLPRAEVSIDAMSVLLEKIRAGKNK